MRDEHNSLQSSTNTNIHNTHNDNNNGSNKNTIAWQNWTDQAFEQARTEDKPILLSIGAVWCHWCHVMDKGVEGDPVHSGTYNNPDVIELIQQAFIPIRVDNDQRPDINQRYNMGGWPTTCFLTPTGQVIYGSTYLTAGQFKNIAEQVLHYWQQRRPELMRQIGELPKTPLDIPTPVAETTDHEQALATCADLVLQEILSEYDAKQGGLGNGQKFPMPYVWELLLRQPHQTKNPRYAQTAIHTLLAMGSGGMFDLVEGGFFRYSTTPDWSVPHFEKMLEDHARLLPVYLQAIQFCRTQADFAEQETKLTDITQAALDYLTNTLLYTEHGLTYFAGSQDADEIYYGLPLAERQQRPAPFIDWRLYSHWNAMMVGTLLQAAGTLNQPHYAQLADNLLKTLIRLCVWPDGGVVHSIRFQENAASPFPQAVASDLVGQMEDQMALALACMQIHLGGESESRITCRPRLDIADKVLGYSQTHHRHKTQHVFADKAADPQAVGLLALPVYPFMDNLLAAKAFYQRYRIRNRAEDKQQTRTILQYFAAQVARFGSHAAEYACIVQDYLLEDEWQEVVIIGTPEENHAFVVATLQTHYPQRLVRQLHPEHDAQIIIDKGYVYQKTPVLFLCQGTRCSAPQYQIE